MKRGNRLELREGEWVKVLGGLRVTDHKAAVVNGVFVLAWVEVRVEEK